MTNTKTLVTAGSIMAIVAAGLATGGAQSGVAMVVWISLAILPLALLFAFMHSPQRSMSEIIHDARR